LYNKINNITNIIDLLGVYFLFLVFLVFYIILDKPTKNIVWGSVISYNSPKLAYNTIIFKDKKKDKELVFFTITKYFLENKNKKLFLLVVRNKININY
jgi:hypothetical protein